LALLTRTVIAGAVIAAVFLTAGLIATLLVIARLVVVAILTGPIITGPIITGPIITGPIIAGPIIAVTVITALLARHFGQIDQSGFFGIHHGKTGGIGLFRVRLVRTFGAVIAPLGAVILTVAVAAVLVAVLVPALGVLIALLILLALFLLGRHLSGRFGQHAGVMFGVLGKVLGRHAVVGPLCITGQHLILLDDLLRGAAHLALGARAVEHTVDDIAEGARAVRL
jgi:hypothetical protein